MDILTHMLIGSALCSRTGLAGWKKGPLPKKNGKPGIFDWTLGASLFFGLFPDLASIGMYLIYSVLFTGHMGWHRIPEYVFMLYNLTHSLVIAMLFVLAAALISKPLAITVLAWPIHIITDMFTHGPGRFATPVFFPVSDYRFAGVNWWESQYLQRWPLLIMTLVWISIVWLRWKKRATPLCLSGRDRRIQEPVN